VRPPFEASGWHPRGQGGTEKDEHENQPGDPGSANGDEPEVKSSPCMYSKAVRSYIFFPNFFSM